MKRKYSFSLVPLIVCEFVACVLFIIAFGFSNFLLFMLFSMIIGVILLAIFWKNMLDFQVLSVKEMLKQFSFVIAAFLLIVPGVLSSIFGFLVFLFALFFSTSKKSKEYFSHKFNHKDEEIIDVEIIEERK
ncbi:FxsA family protein [Campylobacter jejuni]|nr:FxsA family protein [Campylobacter jejuni]